MVVKALVRADAGKKVDGERVSRNENSLFTVSYLQRNAKKLRTKKKQRGE
jgi:hypothetical protein